MKNKTGLLVNLAFVILIGTLIYCMVSLKTAWDNEGKLSETINQNQTHEK